VAARKFRRLSLKPQIALKIVRNLSALLAQRLILANAKVDLLSAY
jgi:glutaminase